MKSGLYGALAGLLLAPSIVFGGEIVQSTVVKDAGTYTIDLLARIEAPLEVVHWVITSYDELTEINPAIIESFIVDRQGPDTHRVFTRLEICLLVFCKRFEQVQDILVQRNDFIKATIIPELSDFESGSATWKLVVADGVTYMEFHASMDPAFWVPPLIGTKVIEREMNKQVMEIVNYIEAQGGQ